MIARSPLLVSTLILVCVAGWVRAAETWSALPVDQGEAAPAVLPVEVSTDHEELRYDGRFDYPDARQAVCAWPASAVTVRFRGTAVNVCLDPGANRFVAAVDGVPVKILAGSGPADPHRPPAPKWYAVATGLPDGEHQATIFKATEASLGNATFAGFALGAGSTLLPAKSAAHRFTVIGDSISCGFGNEAANEHEKFTPATENAWWTYGAIAARAVGADYTCIAWSGRKMYPDNTLPEIYDRTLPTDAKSRWAGDRQPPDAILINLCTNDFRFPQEPDHAGWVEAYRRFVVRLRQEAPQATIYCALGPMIQNGSPAGRPSLDTARAWIDEVVQGCHDAGDQKVRRLEFATQQRSDGLGASYHPSVRTHQIMAEKLVEALRADLGW